MSLLLDSFLKNNDNVAEEYTLFKFYPSRDYLDVLLHFLSCIGCILQSSFFLFYLFIYFLTCFFFRRTWIERSKNEIFITIKRMGKKQSKHEKERVPTPVGSCRQ
jgi:hypothetical protein